MFGKENDSCLFNLFSPSWVTSKITLCMGKLKCKVLILEITLSGNKICVLKLSFVYTPQVKLSLDCTKILIISDAVFVSYFKLLCLYYQMWHAFKMIVELLLV